MCCTVTVPLNDIFYVRGFCDEPHFMFNNVRIVVHFVLFVFFVLGRRYALYFGLFVFLIAGRRYTTVFGSSFFFIAWPR